MSFKNLDELARGPILVTWSAIHQCLGRDPRTCKKIVERRGLSPCVRTGKSAFYHRDETLAFFKGLSSGAGSGKELEKTDEV